MTYAVLSQRIRLLDEDIDLPAELLAADGVDTSALSMVTVADTDPMPMFGFSATRAGLREATVVAAADAKCATRGRQSRGSGRAIHRGRRRGSSLGAGLWRAWRFPGNGPPGRPRAGVWVIETDAGVDLIEVTGRMQRVLDGASDAYPQVEV